MNSYQILAWIGVIGLGVVALQVLKVCFWLITQRKAPMEERITGCGIIVVLLAGLSIVVTIALDR